MSPLPVTLGTASLLALLFVILTIRVLQNRLRSKISLGDGSSANVALGDEANASGLLVACRAHANFAEYVPLSLLLIGFIEFSGGKHVVVVILAALLLAARLLHPIGMSRKAPNVFRGGGTLLQLAVLVIGGIYGIMLILPHM